MQSSTFVGYNMTGPVTEASSERLFGYVVMGRSGGSYTLSARDGTNTQHFFTSVGMSTTLNHALALPTSANGSQNSTLGDGWIAFITLAAVFGLVILIVGIIFTQGSGKPSQPTDSSDCAAAPKESVVGIEADEADEAPVDLITPSAATRECC